MMPTRKIAEQIASVGIMSKRVEQASASAARIQSANKIKIAAGTIRQSTAAISPRDCDCLVNWKMTNAASVIVITSAKKVSLTNGRRRKKLLKPPSKYASAKAPATIPTAARSVLP